MKNSIQAVAYLLRKTSLTLTEIRELGVKQFKELFDEVAFQETTADYQTASHVANIMASIANTVPSRTRKTFKAEDFLRTRPPKRRGEGGQPDAKAELEILAMRFKIKLPGKELIDL